MLARFIQGHSFREIGEQLSISRDGDAIRSAFLAAFPNGGSPSQLAEFLTSDFFT